jgi:hypothetical protein
MKTTVLTSAQQTEAAVLQAAVVAAQTSLKTARQTLQSFLAAASSATSHQRLQLTNDGTTVVIF